MFKKSDKNTERKAKHNRIRHTLVGTAERPRLNVYRSINQIYVQVIDDNAGKTLVSASSLDKELAGALAGKNKKEQAYVVGEAIANRAIKAGIKKVVFDRGGYIYTGRVESIADGARSAGLDF